MQSFLNVITLSPCRHAHFSQRSCHDCMAAANASLGDLRTLNAPRSSHGVATGTCLSPVAYQIGVTHCWITTFCLIVNCPLPTNEARHTVHPVSTYWFVHSVQCGLYLSLLKPYATVMNGSMSQLIAWSTFAVKQLAFIHLTDRISHSG